MYYYNIAWIVTSILGFSTLYANGAACPAAGPTYGTTQVDLYGMSHNCTGKPVTRTVQGAHRSNSTTNSECYIAKPFNGIELHGTSQGIAQNCDLYWYRDQTCQEYVYDHGAYAGLCFDARDQVSYDPAKYEPSQSFQFTCYG